MFSGGGVVLFGDGLGGFPTATLLPQFVDGIRFVVTTVADVDGNGAPDLVASSNHVLQNDGAGTFPTHRQLSPVSGVALSTDPGRFLDLNGDGRVDIVRVSPSDGVILELADGSGGFALPDPYAAGLGSNELAVGDVDGDGRPDVVVDGGAALHLLRNRVPTPAGIAPFGTGTPTCRGRIGIWGTPEPSVGEAGFGVACSNAPPEALGLLAMGTKVANGWDPLGFDLLLHLGFAAPVATAHSDSGGSARFGLPIPPLPFLTHLRVHVQSFWFSDAVLGNTCSPALFDLASSRGLTITLQP